MKYFVLLFVLIYITGCRSYQPIVKDNIQAVYVLFTDSSWYHYDGYRLYDGTRVTWDVKHSGVKTALNDYKNRISELPQNGPDYLERFLLDKKVIKYLPIKTVPLKEFGFIETKSNKLIFYGIGDETLMDLTYDKVYISRPASFKRTGRVLID